MYRGFEKCLLDKLIFGSYPEAVLTDNDERKFRKIDDILNSYLRKDIKEQMGVEDTVLYKRILELLGISFGNLINVNNISNELGVSYHNISKLLNIAVETYIIDKIRPFFKNKKTEIVKSPKVYFEDTGIRNFLIKNMSRDILLRMDYGALIENFVYNEIISRKDILTEIKFWRSTNNSEIDFLLVKNQEILPIEVKGGSTNNIPQSIIAFCRNNRIKRGIVFNKDISKIEKTDNIEIFFIPFLFAARIQELFTA